jgi:prophage regulatory protein
MTMTYRSIDDSIKENAELKTAHQELTKIKLSLPELSRIPDLERALPFKRSWIYSAIKKGQFPAPVRLGDGITVWPRSTVEAWLSAKISKAEG